MAIILDRSRLPVGCAFALLALLGCDATAATDGGGVTTRDGGTETGRDADAPRLDGAPPVRTDAGTITDPAATTLASSLTVTIERDRINRTTFHFAEEVQLGQFADGSYFVVPAPGHDAVTISSVEGEGGLLHADENPFVEAMALTDDSRGYWSYAADEALTFPLTRGGNTSIVTAIQRDEATAGDCGTAAIVGECVDSYTVLTILDHVPWADTLRPSITTEVKELVRMSDFDFSRLPRRDYFDPMDADRVASSAERWRHQIEVFGVDPLGERNAPSEGGRAFRAAIFGSEYGSSVAAALLSTIAAFFSDATTVDDIAPALAAVLVYAKDLYYALFDGTTSRAGIHGGAGQSHGRIPALALYAALLRDNATEVANVSRLSGSLGMGDDTLGPPELDQVNEGHNGPIWGDGDDPALLSELAVGSYWGSVLKHQCFDGATGTCDSNSGAKNQGDPHRYIDGPPTPGQSYFSVSFGPNEGFAAMMILMPSIREMVDHDILPQFIQRVTEQGLLTQDDPCAPPDPREDPDTCDAYRRRDCVYYGLNHSAATPTWGPDPDDTDWSDGIDCIHNAAGQQGRYPAMHGLSRGPGGYVSAFHDVWPQIAAEADWL